MPNKYTFSEIRNTINAILFLLFDYYNEKYPFQAKIPTIAYVFVLSIVP